MEKNQSQLNVFMQEQILHYVQFNPKCGQWHMNKDNRNKTMKLNWIEIEWKSSIFHSVSVQPDHFRGIFFFVFVHTLNTDPLIIET